MHAIELVNGGIAYVDDADAPAVRGRTWRAQYRYENGQRGQIGSVVSGSVALGTFVRLHRLLIGALPEQLVDHVDGDPLNNRRMNLRICTAGENSRNRRTAKSNQAGVKGIYQDRRSGSWRAEIKVDGQKHRLGTFTDKADAAAAYERAAKELHGAFARAA